MHITLNLALELAFLCMIFTQLNFYCLLIELFAFILIIKVSLFIIFNSKKEVLLDSNKSI